MESTHSLMDKFRVEDLGVKEFRHWIVAVRAKQVTLGSSVILLKRAEPSVGGLRSGEAADFIKACRWWEARATQLWAPDRFNYVAAMMKDPFVHFHAIPRYEESRTLNGIQFDDDSWPGLISFRDIDTSGEVLASVRSLLSC